MAPGEDGVGGGGREGFSFEIASDEEDAAAPARCCMRAYGLIPGRQASLLMEGAPRGSHAARHACMTCCTTVAAQVL